MRLFSNQQGTTLVELIIVVTLFAFMGLALMQFLLGTVTGQAKAAAQIEVQEQARFAMARMAHEIRHARGFEGTADFGVNYATNPGDSLDLDMHIGGDDPTVIDVASGIIRISQGGGPAVELTSDEVTVTDLTVEDRTSANGRSEIVTVTLTMTHPDPSGNSDLDYVFTLETAVALRDTD